MYRYEKLVVTPADDSVLTINVDLIPEYQRRQLAEFALELTRNVFAQPGEEERYQTWLAERKRRLGNI